MAHTHVFGAVQVPKFGLQFGQTGELHVVPEYPLLHVHTPGAVHTPLMHEEQMAWSQSVPFHPDAQLHSLAPEHVPCAQPALTTHESQSAPDQPDRHLQSPGVVHPPLTQPARQIGLSQFTPVHPDWHTQPYGIPPASPFTHVGDLSAMLHAPPVVVAPHPELHVHVLGAVHAPFWPHEVVQMGTSHNAPDHPVMQMHSPGLLQRPLRQPVRGTHVLHVEPDQPCKQLHWYASTQVPCAQPLDTKH